ncbi:hypothetical protein THAOC_14674, partial [Thalassiosira oceanica]
MKQADRPLRPCGKIAFPIRHNADSKMRHSMRNCAGAMGMGAGRITVRRTFNSISVFRNWRTDSDVKSARLTIPVRRTFNSISEFRNWRTDVKSARLTVSPTSLCGCAMEEAAPFLYSVSPMADRLRLESLGRKSDVATDIRAPKSPRDSLLQVTYPLSRDELLKNSVTDFSNWSSFRLGKFYEVVDALTADVSYRHCGDINGVSAGHYHSRKLQRTSLAEDLTVRSYVTSVGTSSMEVRTDAIQQVDGGETLVNVCHTVMVALDKDSGKPFGK